MEDILQFFWDTLYTYFQSEQKRLVTIFKFMQDKFD